MSHPENTPPRRNLERKARCADLDAARRTVEALGARREGVQVQADTFFRVPSGRLKLRVVEDQPATLIWYDRREENTAELDSRYHLAPVADPAALRTVLAAALGVRGEVRKRREVYHHHNVRIHLDRVEGLGGLVEFEAVLGPGADEAESRRLLEELGQRLGLTPADDLAGSNIDLLGR